MPKIAMTTDNKAPSFETYPPLKYKTGEKGRVCLIDAEPSVIYVHEHRMPVVVNGEIVKETKKGKTGEYEVDKTDYAGKYACSGDFAVVAKERTDAANCDQCKWAIESPTMFSPPKRRFGMHVIKYKTQPGSSTIVQPFSFDLVLYQYTDFRFDGLVEMAKEHGNLREKDLTVNCVSGDFNNFDFQIGGTCEWTTSDERKRQVAEAYQNQRAEDVDSLLARKATKTDLAMVLDKVVGRHNLIGKASVDDGSFGDLGLDSGALDNMFGTPASTPAPDFAQDAVSAASEAPVAASQPVEATPVAAPVEVASEEGSTEGSGFADLDSFLSGL